MIDKGGLHYQPDADVDPVEGTYSDIVRRWSLPVEKYMKKRYIDVGRGLALLALRPSGKLKSVLEDCLDDSRSSYYHHGDRRASRPNLGNKPLSTPTDSAVDVPDCLARLGLERDEPPSWLKVYERLLKWATV